MAAKGTEPTSESEGEAEGGEYMVYYMRGGVIIRPMAIVTGDISQHHEDVKPYPLRRSCGEIQVVPFEPSEASMKEDHEYIMETNVHPQNSSSLSFRLDESAKLVLAGEMFGGVSLEGPSFLELNGKLHLAYWNEKDELVEELVDCNCLVEVTHGTATLIVCDRKHLVLMYDDHSRYSIALVHEEGEEGTERPNSSSNSKSSNAAHTLNRIIASANWAHQQASGRGQASNGTSQGAPSTSTQDCTQKKKKTVTIHEPTTSSPSESQSASEDKPPTGSSSRSSSCVKVKIKRKVRKGNSTSKMKVKRSTARSTSTTGKSTASQIGKGRSLTRGSHASLVRFGSNTLAPRERSSGKKTKRAQSSTTSGQRTGKRTPSSTKEGTEVKVGKSKFNAHKNSSSHNLNTLLRNKTPSSDGAKGGSGGAAALRSKSANRARPLSVTKVNAAGRAESRPRSGASMRSNPSRTSSVQTRSQTRLKSEQFKVKAKSELDRLLHHLEKRREQGKDISSPGDEELLALKERMAQVTEALGRLTEDGTDSSQAQLQRDLATLRQLSAQTVSVEQLDEYTDKITDIVRKIDGQLEAS